MKPLYTFLVFLSTIALFAQAPQGFNYQATVRNGAGALMINQNVTFKFNLMRDTPTSMPVFTETHYAPTDDLGAVTLIIGKGTASSAAFETIDWSNGNYYLGIELNTGNGFVAMGTTQLLSVPYALYAHSAGGAVIPDLASILATNNSANQTKITNLANPTDDSDAVTKAYVDLLEAKITALENTINTNMAALENTINTNMASIETINANISFNVSDAEGNSYATVKIGKQVYTTENLNVSKYKNGDLIPEVTDPTEWANLTTGAWCYYNNDPANGAVYGKLYNWYAVADSRGLAPEGWHVPSDKEWTSFTAFSPGGMRAQTGTFVHIGTNGHWWTSTEYSSDPPNSAFTRSQNYLPSTLTNNQQYKTRGLAIRCLKN